MSFPQGISRLLIVVFTIPLFLISAASAATSASFQGTNWKRLAASPSSVNFGNVQVGSSQTRYETLTNSGKSTVTISQATVTGAGFSLSGLSLPLSLNKGQSVTFSVLFTPKVGGSTRAGIAVVSNASTPALSIALSGTGIPAGHLITSVTTLNFGSVTLGTSKTLTATLTATGSSVTDLFGDFHQSRVQSGWVISSSYDRGRSERVIHLDLRPAEQRYGIREHFSLQQRSQYTDGRDPDRIGHGNIATQRQSSLELQSFRGCRIQRIPQRHVGGPVHKSKSGPRCQHELHRQLGSRWNDLLLREYRCRYQRHRKHLLKPVASCDSQPLRIAGREGGFEGRKSRPLRTCLSIPRNPMLSFSRAECGSEHVALPLLQDEAFPKCGNRGLWKPGIQPADQIRRC